MTFQETSTNRSNTAVLKVCGTKSQYQIHDRNYCHSCRRSALDLQTLRTKKKGRIKVQREKLSKNKPRCDVNSDENVPCPRVPGDVRNVTTHKVKHVTYCELCPIVLYSHSLHCQCPCLVNLSNDFKITGSSLVLDPNRGRSQIQKSIHLPAGGTPQWHERVSPTLERNAQTQFKITQFPTPSNFQSAYITPKHTLPLLYITSDLKPGRDISSDG